MTLPVGRNYFLNSVDYTWYVGHLSKNLTIPTVLYGVGWSDLAFFAKFLFLQKMGETVFDLKNSLNFYEVSLVFAFKKAKEHILFQVKP